MNILVLTPVFPYPPTDGDRLRIFNLIKEMGKENKIYLISFLKSGEEENIAEMKKYCSQIITVYISKKEIILNAFFALITGKAMNVFSYYKREMQQIIDNFILKNKIDVIFAYRIRMAQYVKEQKIPKMVDFVDSLALYISEKIKYERNFLTLLYLLIDKGRVLRYEKELIKKFNYVLLNYEDDKNFLNSEKNIFVLPNGVTYDSKKTSLNIKDDTVKIGFLGDMNYAPNIDGIKFFYKNVWKKINKFDKNLQLILAGKDSDKIKVNESVKTTGFIKNIDAEIKTWQICVVPVRYGAGRQNKILKAWLNEIPVVATSFSAKSVYGKDFYNILIADNREEFINKINILINDKRLRKKIIKNALSTIKKHFNWNMTGKLLRKLIRRLK